MRCRQSAQDLMPAKHSWQQLWPQARQIGTAVAENSRQQIGQVSSSMRWRVKSICNLLHMIKASVEMKVNFVDFEFLATYYMPREDYKPKIVEEWFREGLKVCSPHCMDADLPSPYLQLQAWKEPYADPLYYFDHDKMILVQILHMMPLRLNGFDAARYVVHEMVVVVWECDDYWKPTNPFGEQYKAFRRSEDQFFIVLDRWISKTVINVEKSGQFGMVFCPKMFKRMHQNSKELGRKLREEVDFGLTVNLGQTMQQISQNQDGFYRARCMLRRVVDLIDVAFVRYTGVTTDQRLQQVGLCVTDDLDTVKPSPMPFPERIN